MSRIGRLFEKFGKRGKEAKSARLLEEAKAEGIQLLEKLRRRGRVGDYSDREDGGIIDALNEIPGKYFICPKDWQEDDDFTDTPAYRSQKQLLGTYLADEGYVEQFVKIASSSAIQYSISGFRAGSQGMTNLESLCLGLHNYSDACADICNKLAECGGIEICIKIITSLEENYSNSDSRSVVNILQTCILILCNSKDHDAALRKANAVEVLQRYTRSQNMILQTAAVLIISRIGSDHDREALKTKDCIRFYVELLRSAYNSKHHIGYPGYDGDPRKSKTIGFSLTELLDGLNDLAINDDTKFEIHRCGGKKILDQVLLSDRYSSLEKKLAAKVLWSLAFVVRDDWEIKESKKGLRALQSSEDPSLKETTTYALWEMEGHKQSMPTKESVPSAPLLTDESADLLPPYDHVVTDEGSLRSSKNTCNNVMISYQMGNLMQVANIKVRLLTMGFTVYTYDLENEGDVLSRQTKAIEEADVVLLCVSRKYKNSSSCRTEANYALNLKKRVIPLLVEDNYEPDGWVQRLIGNRDCYRCCSEKEIESNMANLVDSIKGCSSLTMEEKV